MENNIPEDWKDALKSVETAIFAGKNNLPVLLQLRSSLESTYYEVENHIDVADSYAEKQEYMAVQADINNLIVACENLIEEPSWD